MKEPAFDARIVHEAVLNMVSHWDFQLGGSVFVTQQQLALTYGGGKTHTRIILRTGGGAVMSKCG